MLHFCDDATLGLQKIHVLIYCVNGKEYAKPVQYSTLLVNTQAPESTVNFG